jgi:hypothetical protein
MKTKIIFLMLLCAATNQVISTVPIHAEPSKPNQIPLKITVEKVSITNEDVDQAAKFCLIKEGSLEKGSTIHEQPTAAQLVVMATMCN